MTIIGTLKADSHDKIYVMDRFFQNEDFPFTTDNGIDVIEPYQETDFVIAVENRKGNTGDVVQADSIDEVILTLKPFSGEVPIILGRHPMYPGCINIDGDLELYRGLDLDGFQSDFRQKFRKNNIKFTEKRD